MADDEVIEERRNLLRVYGRRTVACWERTGTHMAWHDHVRVGWHADGWWWVHDSREHYVDWVYSGGDQRGVRAAAMARARTQVERDDGRGGRWVPGVAEFDPNVWPARAAPVPAPEWPPGHEPGDGDGG
jgi:hypothetical protein